jgi:hypothetical protein
MITITNTTMNRPMGPIQLQFRDVLCGALEYTSAETSRATVKANRTILHRCLPTNGSCNSSRGNYYIDALGRVVPKAVKRNKRRPKSLVAASPVMYPPRRHSIPMYPLSRQRRSSDMEHMQRGARHEHSFNRYGINDMRRRFMFRSLRRIL